MIYIIVVTRCYHYCDNCNDKCGCHLAGERREPRVLRVEGGSGERSESQKVCLMIIIISSLSSFWLFSWRTWPLLACVSCCLCWLSPLIKPDPYCQTRPT